MRFSGFKLIAINVCCTSLITFIFLSFLSSLRVLLIKSMFYIFYRFVSLLVKLNKQFNHNLMNQFIFFFLHTVHNDFLSHMGGVNVKLEVLSVLIWLLGTVDSQFNMMDCRTGLLLLAVFWAGDKSNRSFINIVYL